jgi:hypothetical protein
VRVELETRGNLELNNGLHVSGETNLPSAHIGGVLDCGSGTFTNPNGRALYAVHITRHGDGGRC